MGNYFCCALLRNEYPKNPEDLTKEKANHVSCPIIKESPVSIECRVKEIRKLGSHDMFVAEVVAVHVDDKYMDKNQKFALAKPKPIVYSHGEYHGLTDVLGTFGYSIKKKKS